jgi:alkylhydroperoxidase/carboxymuconolactone decarboxylase family protein YurZ
MHVGAAAESGVTVDDVQDVLVAVAPIIGAPRVLSAALKITEALGFVVAVAEAEAEQARSGV